MEDKNVELHENRLIEKTGCPASMAHDWILLSNDPIYSSFKKCLVKVVNEKKWYLEDENVTLTLILAKNDLDFDILYDCVSDILPSDITCENFIQYLRGEKFLQPEFRIRIWYAVYKSTDGERPIALFFMRGQLGRLISRYPFYGFIISIKGPCYKATIWA
jgi:hypothetical protein